MSTAFRYGIMEMQLNMLIPSGSKNPAEIMAQLGGLRHSGLIRALADQGFSLIELGGDLQLFFPHFFAPDQIAEVARLKAERGLSFTAHLPLWSAEPSTPLQPVRAGSEQAMIHTIRALQPLEPEWYVLHATGALAAEFYRMRLPETARALLLRQFQANARKSIETILRESGLPSRKLAIETIEFPFELMFEIADSLDLSICLDTGHILAGFSGPITLPEAFQKILPRLGEIHLHDCPWQGPEGKLGYGKDHQALGKGDLDVPALLNGLEKAGWTGPIIFELTVPEALESLKVINGLETGA